MIQCYLKRVHLAAITTAFFLLAHTANAQCPCSCQWTESGFGDYELTSVTETAVQDESLITGTKFVTLKVYPTFSIAKVQITLFASVGNVSESDSTSGSGSYTARYDWTGAPSSAPGAVYDVRFVGNGHTLISGQSVAPSGGSALGNGEVSSSASGIGGGLQCSGSGPNNFMAGISFTSANVSAGVASDTTLGTEDGSAIEGVDHSVVLNDQGTGVVRVLQSWTCDVQSSLCTNPGISSITISSEHNSTASAIATAMPGASGQPSSVVVSSTAMSAMWFAVEDIGRCNN